MSSDGSGSSAVDDARAELLEPLDVLLGGAVLGQRRAADGRRLREQADGEPAQPRLGHWRTARAPTTRARPPRRCEPSARPCRRWGRAGRRRRSGCVPSSASGRPSPQQAAGRRIEQPVSVARPRSQRPAASAAALPPDEPPVVLPGCAGFCTVPYHGFWLVTPQANSCRFAFPTMHGACVERGARPPTPCAPARGRRRSSSRRSCGSPRCRSGP